MERSGVSDAELYGKIPQFELEVLMRAWREAKVRDPHYTPTFRDFLIQKLRERE